MWLLALPLDITGTLLSRITFASVATDSYILLLPGSRTPDLVSVDLGVARFRPFSSGRLLC